MDSVIILSHAALTIAAILAGIQDWRKREVTDWLTWPLFICGVVTASVAAVRLNFLPLVISIFFLIAWYYGWMGGADVRVLVGLWGLWPLAGFLALLATGLWGLILILRKRGKERIPALVTTALAVCLTFLLDVARISLVKV